MKLTILLGLLPSLLWAQVYQHECVDRELISHNYYSFCYDEAHEQASWTEHEINPSFINGNQARTNDFRADPSVTTASADEDDYRGSGYDRGHLVPAGDMKFNTLSMSESFFMSNMSPQLPGFNRGVWRRVENQVRRWVTNQSLLIITGPILEKALPHINGISIPRQYFKIVYDKKNDVMLGFLLFNEKSNLDLKEFITSVDEIERRSGIDFFSNMPMADQARLEQMNQWPSFDSADNNKFPVEQE